MVTVVIRERLDISLTVAALLITVQALTSLLSTIVASSIMDKIGRKLPALIGLVGTALSFFALATANSFEPWTSLAGCRRHRTRHRWVPQRHGLIGVKVAWRSWAQRVLWC